MGIRKRYQGGLAMFELLVDFGLLAVLIVGITALNGIILNVIGIKIFSRGKAHKFTGQNSEVINGWNKVGGTR